MRKNLAQLDDLIAKIMQEQTANQLSPKAGQMQGGDKLDQIRQRLERLEKGLGTLEQRRR